MAAEPVITPDVSTSPPAPAGAPAPPKPGPTERVARAVQAPFTRRALNAAERQLEDEVARHFPQADLTKIREAYTFAVDAHGDQRRASGEPYVSHPLAVAKTLADLGLDP